jgi:SAM-dependent methyltransferase
MDVYEGRDLEVLAEMPNYYAWILRHFSPCVRGQVLEYGAGTGTVSKELLKLADTLTLVEPSANLISTLNKQFANETRVAVIHASLEDHTRAALDSSFDTIVLVNVLEHIEADDEALRRLFRILKPGGALLIFVPALQMLMSKLDRIHGHFRRYGRAELISKVQSCAFKIELCRYFDSIGVIPWFILNTMLGKTEFNPSLVKFNDRLIIPVTQALESLVPVPFGKNLILVARKQH